MQTSPPHTTTLPPRLAVPWLLPATCWHSTRTMRNGHDDPTAAASGRRCSGRMILLSPKKLYRLYREERLASASSGVAWTSPRFWSRERLDAPESRAFDDAKRPFSTCRKSSASIVSAAKSAWESATTRTLAQADRSNIQPARRPKAAGGAPGAHRKFLAERRAQPITGIR